MLTFIHGTNQQELADRLLDECRHAPGNNPLAPEIFVVQNHGIGQWLSLYMARREAVAANLEFEFPSERIWKLIRCVDPGIPDTLPSDRGPMTWSLMKLLQNEAVLSDFENLGHYIREEDPGRRSVRTWKLASKIADVFDQYLVYRPGLVVAWEEGRLQTNNMAERWQARLWNMLVGLWKGQRSDKWLHRARLQRQLWDAMDEQRLDAAGLPDRVSIFGVSNVPPAFIKTMVKLSKLTEVYFYQLSIDPRIKKSTAYQNPMLQSLGEVSANFMARFRSFVRSDPNVAETINWESLDAARDRGGSVFCAVQSDLIMDSRDNGGKPEAPAVDSSIRVHSCHSAMREVEVLYDHLLAVMDENADLNPDDILIMTPDIEPYAPIIEAVFDTPDGGQPEIPYNIADRGMKGGNAAVQTFLNILTLCDSRFKVTDVLDLLDSEPIREVFEFSDSHLNQLDHWIRDNRIRWGIDGAFKQKMKVPESDSYTWQSGINRMLLGYAMKRDEDRLFNSIFPYDEIETSDDAELAGRFSHFLQALFETADSVGETRPPSAWHVLLNQITDTFLPDTKDYFSDLSRIREAIAQLAENAALGTFNDPVPFAVIRSRLQDRLDEQVSGGGRIGRGVTFSSLMPMRSIPFKMIGMIGMNDGAFPRSKIPIEFDLLYLEPQAGDPDQSEEDRHLFLENLLSARSHLYFSYVGQSNQQDTVFPPSVVLREFLDYLEVYYELEPAGITARHRLQAFSPHYFGDKKEGEGLFSYSQTQQAVSRQLAQAHGHPRPFMSSDLPEPKEEWKRLSAGDLVSFFQHPAKFLLLNRLGIYPAEEHVLSKDREPFALDRLDGYLAGQEMLDRFIKKKSLDTFYRNLKARDLLPEGWSGEQAYRQKVNEVREFGTEIQQRLTRRALPDVEINAEINGFQIAGTLAGIYEDALITYRFGKARPKDKVDWWIRHLLFQNVKPREHTGRSLLFTWEKGSFEIRRLNAVDDAAVRLAELLDWYWQGLQKPLHFYCRSSFAYAESVLSEGRVEEKGMAQVVREWEPGWNGFPGEGDDAYHRLAADGREPFGDPQFSALARKFWAPFFEVFGEGG